MPSRVIAIIQSRLGSSRFPGKAFAKIQEKPIIQHVYERVCQTPSVNQVIVAVPSAEEAAAYHRMGVPAWHPEHCEESDVLGRYDECARRFDLHDLILRVTGDCPMWSPDEGQRVIEAYRANEGAVDYVSNLAHGYVDGEDAELFSVAILRRAHVSTASQHDREHVSPWIRRHGRTLLVPTLTDRSHVKTSIDTVEDLERVRAMMEASCLR